MDRPTNQMRPVHPGEILREDFLVPLEMGAETLALALHLPTMHIQEILDEQRSITADIAERLTRYFGGDATSWLVLQATYDLKTLSTRQAIYEQIQPRQAPALP